jgi:hypothetical protein
MNLSPTAIFKKRHFVFLLSLVFPILLYNISTIFPPPGPFNFDPKYKNICLNLKSPSSLSLKDQLREFQKGPCSPLIFAPGLGAIRQKVAIDCKTLQANEPDTFSSCYWNTCSNDNFWEIWPIYRKPNPEYGVWLTDIFSPMSYFLPKYFTEQCYYNMLKVNYNPKATSYKDLLIPRKGLEVGPHGTIGQNKSYSAAKCGLDALVDLLPFEGRLEKTSPYKKLLDTLEWMGYTSGMTLQPIPYDTRHSFLLTGFKEKLEKV